MCWAVGEVIRRHRRCSIPILLHRRRGPAARQRFERRDRIVQPLKVARLGGDPGALDQHRHVRRRPLQQLVQQRQRLRIGIRCRGALDFLNEGETRLEGVRRQFHRRRRCARPCSRRPPAISIRPASSTRSALSGASITARSIGAAAASSSPSRRCVNPRFAHAAGSVRDLHGHRCELALRILEQADLERRQAAIERARHQFVGLGARSWKRVASAENEHARRDDGDDGGRDQDTAIAPATAFPPAARRLPRNDDAGKRRPTRLQDALAVRVP